MVHILDQVLVFVFLEFEIFIYFFIVQVANLGFVFCISFIQLFGIIAVSLSLNVKLNNATEFMQS